MPGSITLAFCTISKLAEHLDTDVYKAALIIPNPAGTFGAATTNYSDLGADEVANGNGYATGGVALAGFTRGSSGTTAWFDWTDPEWLAATITSAGLLIYNSTRANRAVAVLPHSNGTVISTNGRHYVALPAPAAATAVIRAT